MNNSSQIQYDDLKINVLWSHGIIIHFNFEITYENDKYVVRQFTLYDFYHEGNYDEMFFSDFEQAIQYIEMATIAEEQMVKEGTYRLFLKENFPICQERGEYYGW